MRGTEKELNVETLFITSFSQVLLSSCCGEMRRLRPRRSSMPDGDFSVRDGLLTPGTCFPWSRKEMGQGPEELLCADGEEEGRAC